MTFTGRTLEDNDPASFIVVLLLMGYPGNYRGQAKGNPTTTQEEGVHTDRNQGFVLPRGESHDQ